MMTMMMTVGWVCVEANQQVCRVLVPVSATNFFSSSQPKIMSQSSPEESLVEAGFQAQELPSRLPSQSGPSGACPDHGFNDDDAVDDRYDQESNHGDVRNTSCIIKVSKM